MNAVERAEFLKQFDKEYCNAVMEAKGDEYSRGSGGGDEDVNANFKLVAKLLDGAPMDKTTVAAVYFLKHVASVCKYVATREEGTEGIYSRIGDARNYLGIMASLIEETNNEIKKIISRKPVEEKKNSGLPWNTDTHVYDRT